jgi:hypothetical protein
MKKILLNLLFALITTLGYSQVPNYVPTNGLVGWWPFNGNAYDESGNGNNGFVANINVVPTTDRNGISNNAYEFLGGGYCGLPSSIGLDNMTSRTLSLWFKDQMPEYMGGYILVSSNNTWGLGLNPQFLTHKISGFCILSNQFYGTAQVTITPSVWTNVVYICDSISQESKFYINGLLVSNNVLSSQIQTNTPNPGLYVGGMGSNNSYYGSIDDIGIWNRALTSCEIQNLYTSTNPSNTTTAAACNSFTWNGQTYTQSGVYSGPTANCVTETLDLTITPSSINTTTAAACNSFTWNGQTYTQSGVYSGPTANCVTESLNLTINSSSSASQSQTALDTYTWPLNNQTYTQGGTYTATIPNAAGCDSVVTLNLTLNYTGINELIGSRVSISPNPTSSKITVKASLALIGKEFTIYDQQGKAVKSGVITAEETEIDLSNLSEGVYLFKAGAEMQETFKIIKQ